MNFSGECPRCPLCPNTAQQNVYQLTNHLCSSHLMKNSGNILARMLMRSQMGEREVAAILKDVKNLILKFVDESEKSSRNKELEIQEMEQKVKSLEVKSLLLSKKDSETKKIDKFSQTDSDSCRSETEAIKDIEIVNLKQTIEEKKISVGILKSQISDTEAQITSGKEDSDGDFGDFKASFLLILKDELKAVKDENFKKDEEIKCLKLLAIEHEVMINSMDSEKNKQKATSLKLVKEKESEQKISAQLIDSQKFVHEMEIQDLNLKLQNQIILHEKGIQDLNLKLQNQINRSQGLKSREKGLLELVETLRADSWKKKDLIESLSNQLNTLKEKISDQPGKGNNSNEKDSDFNRLHGIIASSDIKVKNLVNDVENLKDHLFRKCKGNLELKHCLENYKEVSQENITEKDKMIAYLENELERTKADAEIIVEELAKSTKRKMSCEKNIADMKMKLGRCREIMCLMKDSLTGLAAMHEDTSDKLIEAVQNTDHASQVVVENVKKKFKGFENDIARFRNGQLLVEKIVLNNNVANVKQEPEDTFHLNEGSTSKNAELVAQDLSWEFNMQFGGSGVGKRSHGSSQSIRASEDESGRSTSRWSKKRKFTE